MSTVTVFVDDAVQGRLPMVGATDGAPAEGLHRIHTSIGGSSGWLWLLVFFGPIGWILLIALSLGGSPRLMGVRHFFLLTGAVLPTWALRGVACRR